MSVNHNSVCVNNWSPEMNSASSTADLAKPLHLQKLEQALNVRPFLQNVSKIFETPASEPEISDSESEASVSESEKINGEKIYNGISITKQERRSDKLRLYNFSQVAGERLWLRDVLVTDSDDSDDESNWSTEEHIKHMLYYHQLKRKYQKRFYSNPDNMQYQYYGAGLLSNFDKFNEHQKAIIGNRKKRKKEKVEVKKRGRKPNKEKLVMDDQDLMHLNEEERNLLKTLRIEEEESMPLIPGRGVRGRKKKQLATKSPEVMAQRRRKIWAMMAKREMSKVQKAKANNHKEQLTSCRRVAQHCMRHWRQKAMQSQRNMKETVWRLKRLTREMQAYWKRYDRVERETRRRMEKEAEEQRKMDVELMEAKRQQRKLNFLITQTELYAHFMSRKFGSISSEEQIRILNQLDEEKNPRLASVDDYDSEAVKLKVKQHVNQAFQAEQQRTQQFSAVPTPIPGDASLESFDKTLEDQPQPAIFHGNLKHYQLKGLSWVANLYDQGINGILADEMGLGKTVQSIAVLCHIAEKYAIWGPFLIISPASTLHNWQQEMARFVPDFKVVPYWGNPQERKILRGFWDQKDMHTKEASFHVVITSYQLVIQDFKYFNRIKWQYMILDEAQAIKSTSSVRWKLLQSFSCRNRLLLSGTPIQNSMAELWALLHFIMPTLFDSHDEFNEWFSKDIESHAENKTAMDEKHLTRLHMILKPFMLRRIKKDVENELSDKIEVMVYCPLTTRQKLLYSGLKKKIRIEDLLQTSTGSSQSAQSVTSSLMNLVMQFRKVCNHPELFERRESRSPLYMSSESYVIPKLVAEHGILNISIPSKQHLLYNIFNLFIPEHIHRTIFPDSFNSDTAVVNSLMSWARFLDISPAELFMLFHGGILHLWLYSWKREQEAYRFCHQREWRCEDNLCDISLHRRRILVSDTSALSPYFINNSCVLNSLVFTKGMTSSQNTVYTHSTHTFHAMPETVEHRLLRSKKVWVAELHGEALFLPEKREKEMEEKLIEISPVRQSTRATQSPLKSPRGNFSVVTSSPPTSAPASTPIVNVDDEINSGKTMLPEFPHVSRPPLVEFCVPTEIPRFLYYTSPKVSVRSRDMFASSRAAAWKEIQHLQCGSAEGKNAVWLGSPQVAFEWELCKRFFTPCTPGGLVGAAPPYGWSNVIVPDKQTLVTDAGKLYVLDRLLKRLKEQGHRVLIYSQMTRMIDLLEEYMWHRKHTYMRLDGSSKISERRDMVADFQARTDIFVFLLSTRAGGLGINLTAADTVIFYDSDWNPTVDQQAMDRAHRLGQTKQVTVYRLICKGTIEERILQRAREKSEIQRMVISGETFKPDTLKPKEVVSLLLDDEEIEHKYRQKQRERRQLEEARERERRRRLAGAALHNASPVSQGPGPPGKRQRLDDGEDTWVNVDSNPNSPTQSESSLGATNVGEDTNDNMGYDFDTMSPANIVSGVKSNRRPIRGSRRGRPRGPRRGVGRGRVDVVRENQPDFPGPSSPSAPSTAVSSPGRDPGSGPGTPPTPQVRRGPGRPRLKPGAAPANQGVRGIRRPRKPVRPLPVPLGRVPPEMLLSSTKDSSEIGLGFYSPLDSTPE